MADGPVHPRGECRVAAVGRRDAGQEVEAGPDVGAASELEFAQCQLCRIGAGQRLRSQPVTGDQVGRLACEGVGLLGVVGALGHGEDLPHLGDDRLVGGSRVSRVVVHQVILALESTLGHRCHGASSTVCEQCLEGVGEQ